MIAGPSAFAQDAAAADTASAEQTIVVTGTRIARPSLEQSSPVTVVDAVEIGFRQPINAEELLREIPGVVPNIGAGVNNGANGSAQLDLRGLGANRNLVLLDGRRVVPASNAGVVDLNLVPVALIERVDVFTGGASSVYGADAIAGVVNFVTRRDFAGVDLQNSFGLAEEGDGQTFRTDLTIGANFDDGRGNVVLSMGYSNTDPVLQGDRPWGAVSLSSGNGRPQGSATATPATILFPFTAAVSETPGAPFALGQTNNFNFNPLNIYQTPLERYSLFTKANYEVTDRLEVYAQGMYVRSVIDQQIAPSGTFFSTVALPLSNPFLSAAQRNQLCAGYGIAQAACDLAATVSTPGAPGYIERDIQIGRRFTEAGPRRTNFTTDTFQFTAGMRGPLTETLEWDAFWSYGESSRTNTNNGQGLRSRLQQSLRARSTTACVVATGGCVPINLFGPDGTVSQEAFNFLNVETFNFIQQQFLTAMGTVSGDLGIASPLASEAIGIATGIEYRKFKGASGGDGLSAIPGEVLGAGAAALPIRGQYDTTEIFGEVIVPLIEDRPFFQNLTLEAGFRYSDYSTSGGNWAYKLGGSWIPVDGIKIRGNYNRAVRAPNIGELFQPQITGLTNRTVDPCQLALPTGNPTLTALCSAQLAAVGAPASQLGQIPGPIAGQINFTSGGNPNLGVETADTYTIGAVITPGFLPGFSATVDYYNIHLFDAISTPSQGDVIDACFAQTDPNSLQCRLISRNPLTGGLSGPNDTTFGPFLGLSNLGTIKTDGIDFGVNYRVDAGFANLSFFWNGNYTFSNRFQATPSSVDRECVGFFSVNCGPIQPEWSWNARATMSLPSDTEISVRWRYIGGVELEPLINPATILDAYESIGAFNYFDLALSQQIGEHLRLTLTVDNLFDKDPPVVGNTVGTTAFNSGNTYPTTYDAIGRRWRIGVNFRF